jgi:hypothetical protein
MTSPFFLRRLVLSAAILSIFCPAVFAEEKGDGNLHVSGGISMPSTATSVFTNPAGLVGAHTALELQAGAPEVWNNGTYRAGLQTGGSNFGVAAGIEDQDRGNNSPLNAYYGLGVGGPGFSLGLAGKTGISHGHGSTLNAGLLFSAGSSAQIGLTARGLNDGVNEFGAGVAFKVNSDVAIIVDSAVDEKFKNPELKPGIKVGSGPAALTLSYGTGAKEEFADGFTAGASFQFASSNVLEIQYNAGGELSKYFAAFTLGF